MKFGLRKPSFKKSIAAKTVGKAKRNLMKSIIPNYGTRNSSIFNPYKKAYNKLYNKTTFSINDVLSTSKKNTFQSALPNNSNNYTNLYLDANIPNTIPNASFFKTIVNQINKLAKQTDIIKFFTNLNGINNYIESLKELEHNYGNYQLSNSLIAFMNSNRQKIIDDFIDRNYQYLNLKISQLKTEGAKQNNIKNYIINFNFFEKDLSEENKKKIQENYTALLKLL